MSVLEKRLKTSMLQTNELDKTLAEALEREELLRKEVQSLLLTRATLKDPQLCRFYTGLRSVQVFDMILNFVKPGDIADMRYPGGHTAHDYQGRKPGPQPSLSPEQQLLITLGQTATRHPNTGISYTVQSVAINHFQML